MSIENTPTDPNIESVEAAGSSSPRTPVPRGASDRGTGILRIAAVVYGGMAIVVVGCGALADRSVFYASEAAKAAGGSFPMDATAGIVAGCAMVALSRVFTRRTQKGDAMARALAEVLGRVSVRDAIVLALLSGVAEEMLFRGLLQPMIGWVAASLLFGAAHIAPRRDLWLWTGTSVVAGFVLGALFAATENLVAPVVAHFTVNATNLRWLSVHYAGPRSAE